MLAFGRKEDINVEFAYITRLFETACHIFDRDGTFLFVLSGVKCADAAREF